VNVFRYKPAEEIYWIEEGKLAGRCGPIARPFAPGELSPYGAVLSLDALEATFIDDLEPGTEHRVIHLPPSIPPGPIDREIYKARVPEAVEFLLRIVEENKSLPVLVHCHAGNDRTGIVLTGYLCAADGLPPVDSVDRIRLANPEALSAPGYEDMALDILAKLV